LTPCSFDVVLSLRDPEIDSDSLTYTVEVLDGTLPARAGPWSLFIDALGRPLTPAFALGISRSALS